jgi:predicted nucleic acid-binding protein
MSRLVVLDNEPVQALKDPAHRWHRQVVSQVQVVASRKRSALALEMVVPTTVRVEAGWDRTSRAWAFPNRLRIADGPLDSAQADAAAAIRSRRAVSVADAHLGAVIQSATAEQVIVITSDPGDMRLVAGETAITVVAI